MNAFTIANQELVVQHFGNWPSFHDAEVISIVFERGMPGYWPLIRLKVEVIEECLIELDLLQQRVYANFEDENFSSRLKNAPPVAGISRL